IAWVGLAFLSMLMGDVWALINPWSAAFGFAESLRRRQRGGGEPGFGLTYPEWLGVWPAVLLFVAFAWLELVWGGKSVPAELAAVLIAYSGLTWLGMAAFGRPVWLQRGEVFTLVFGIFARFAPLARTQDGGLRMRMPASGLFEHPPSTLSMVALVVALLATV